MSAFDRIKENKSFSTILLVSSFVWIFSILLFMYTTDLSKTEIINVEADRAMAEYESVLHNVFDHLNKIQIFTETVGVDNLDQAKFDEFVRINSFDNIGFISLSIAPAGIIDYYYTPYYETSLVTHNLIDDERDFVREAVAYTIENNVIVINGPFELLQGGNGLVFRKAIFEDGEFVAIINLVVEYENLNMMFSNLDSDVVDLGIYNKDNELIFGELEYANDLDFYERIELENVDWNVGVKVSDKYRFSFVITNATILTLSSLLYILAIVLGTKFYRSNKNMLSYQNKLINYDNLTGLPNRRLLSKDLEIALSKGNQFYLGFGDLDNFKNLNDILGHSVGDNYLKGISSRLDSLTSDTFTIYRWGGDEFIFLFLSDNKEETIEVINSVYKIFKEPIIIKGTNYNVSMSIGIVNYPNHGDTIDDLIKRADIVMYDIKAHSKNTFGFFEDKYLDNLQREVDFENKVYEYLLDVHTDEIIGFEALSRLFDKDGKLINTQEVIRVYERKGDIFKLDKYIFEATCKHSVKLKEEFDKKYSFSFNISPITLSIEYIEFLKSMIEKYQIDPNYFVIEIIETTGFKDINESVKLLNELKDIGFKIAMDDFGMGFSSLSYITRLPLSLIKIDRNFVQNYQTNKFDKMLILTIRDISKSLGIRVVVEGIETKEQLEFINEIGAHYYQGYFHSKPMSYNNLIKFMKKKE